MCVLLCNSLQYECVTFFPLACPWTFGFSCYFLAIMNKAAVNILETSSIRSIIYGSVETFLLSMYLGVHPTRPICLCLSFIRNS